MAFSQPLAAQSVSGTYTFAVSTNMSSLSSVEFTLGSKRLGVATSAPFNLVWNTGYASDGSYAVQATGRDAYGNIIATAQQFFTINNNGVSLTVTSSTDLTRPVSGVVPLTLTGYDPQYYPAIWMVNLDGSALGADAWTDHAGTNSNTVTTSIDTQFWPNGPHELYIGMYSNYWPSGNPGDVSWYDWRGGAEMVLNVNNGHTLMGLAANYLHLYLQPGGTATLTCSQMFTDNTTGPCSSPSYSTSDSTVVTVSSGGVVTAGSNEGFATITLADPSSTYNITTVNVWVRNSLGVPHFSGSGQMLNSYQPGSSLFVVAPFSLQPSDIAGSPHPISDAVSLADVQAADVNTISRGFYLNPYSTTSSYSDWQTSYDSEVAPDWTWAADSGFHILATGDDVCRNIGSEAWDTLNWPSGQQAVQHAMQSLASSGVAISVDMVDEVSSMWGSTPTPPGSVSGLNSWLNITSVTCSTSSSGGTTCTVNWPNNSVNSGLFPGGASFALSGSGGSADPLGKLNTPAGQMFTATNITSNSFDFTPAGPISGTFTASNDPGLQFVWWTGNEDGCPSPTCNPPVPNNALASIRGWITSAPASVPISWPPLGEAGIDTFANWLGPGSVSDYASEYWISSKVRHTYTWAQGVQESDFWMGNAFYSRQPFMMLDKPQLLLGQITSFEYIKNTSGATYYTPPGDTEIQPGADGPAVTGQMMTAAALGAAGVRLYEFDEPWAATNRTYAPLGSEEQTGANPTATDPNVVQNWRAMAYAANPLTTTLTPYVLGTAIDSPSYGGNPTPPVGWGPYFANIITAVREGSNALMLMIVNDNDFARTLPVNFTPYRTGNSITRYQIRSDGISTDVLPDESGETITLGAGASAVYLFPTSSGTHFTTATPIAAPSLPSGASKAALHYSYIYSDALPQQFEGIDCASGCTVNQDPNFGTLYYQFTFLDSANHVLGQSAVMSQPGSGS